MQWSAGKHERQDQKNLQTAPRNRLSRFAEGETNNKNERFFVAGCISHKKLRAAASGGGSHI
jgi:hypothetical protein